ncbi:hypothetical protein CU098_003932 [Rhizopus stolonifer]|uniref:ZZ-type domain-containing protein n=1 Tax=Rhizopus stolonifer TaxID=4846 RepID=A0A367JLU2_RHIST|nr:hypothetical protein CU098_003932 [Rhizopus stolonifer]
MSRVWFKIIFPQKSEICIVPLITLGLASNYLSELKDNTRTAFDLDKDYDFYFTFIDNEGDEISIKNNSDLFNRIVSADAHTNTNIKLKIIPAGHQNFNITDQKEPNVSESIQSMMKHLELGINNLQATVERSAATTVDNVVKTAAETAAQVYRSLLSTPSLSEQPQFDVICDGCYSPIRGQRYRCETCDDFDLCSTCKSRVNHNPSHNFRHISTVNNNIPLSTPEPYVSDESSCSSYWTHNLFICDYCDTEIVGIRHTCGACPDFDVCHSCFSTVKENHPRQHTFVTRLVGAQAANRNLTRRRNKHTTSHDMVPTTKHVGVRCDSCDVSIEGVRFKCGHCANYDLCETCEEHAFSIHDKNHVFIKIRRPIRSITDIPLLPRFNFLYPEPVKQTNKTSESSSSRSNSIEIISKPEEINSSTSLPGPIIAASFVADLNIPDGTIIVPKKTFIKMWKVKNTGNVEWPIGSHLLFNGGSILRPYPISRPDCFAVPVIAPNEETCVSAELQAPDSPGSYTSFFCLCAPNGERFGDNLWCTITVDEDLEPDKGHSNTATSSKSPVMINSHTMIYPKISTSPLLHDSDKEQEHFEEVSHTDLEVHDNSSETTGDHASDRSRGRFDEMLHLGEQEEKSRQHIKYDGDNSSETTGDYNSTVETNTTYTYTDSQVSSPTPSELDLGDCNNHRFDSDIDSDEFSNHAYHVISPSASVTITFDHERNTLNSVEEEEDFVLIEEQDKVTTIEIEDASNISVGHSDLVSSAHSTNTITPNEIQSVYEDLSYRSQLLQLHEMGFTSYDDLALSLLRLYKGELDKVVSKLLEYP